MTTSALIEVNDPQWKSILDRVRHDIYHTTGYVEAEARRLSARPVAFLHEDVDRLFFLPLVLRAGRFLPAKVRDGDGTTDAVSPYGYPGPLINEPGLAQPGFADASIDRLLEILSRTEVCSAFIRFHPLLNETLPSVLIRHPPTPNGATVSIDLSQSEERLWAAMSRGHANAVNKGLRFGYHVAIGPLRDRFDEFCAVYADAIGRLGAQSHYDHGKEHLSRLAELPAAQVAVATSDEEVAAAYLFFEHQGLVQMHLGGPRSAFRKPSPSHLLIHSVCKWARARGNRAVHLGGGVGAASSDSLFDFKLGFSRRRHVYQTLRLVVDPLRYGLLVKRRAASLGVDPDHLESSDFFPAYRAPLPQ